jgi:hypothetical protein
MAMWADQTPHHHLIPPRTASQVIDKIYPKIMVNCLLVRGRFSPVSVCGVWIGGCDPTGVGGLPFRTRACLPLTPTTQLLAGGAGAAVVRDGRAQAPHVHGLPLQPGGLPPVLGRAHHHPLIDGLEVYIAHVCDGWKTSFDGPTD